MLKEYVCTLMALACVAALTSCNREVKAASERRQFRFRYELQPLWSAPNR